MPPIEIETGNIKDFLLNLGLQRQWLQEHIAATPGTNHDAAEGLLNFLDAVSEAAGGGPRRGGRR